MPKKITATAVESLKSINTLAMELKLPPLWLRHAVAAGHVQAVRVGWNLFIDESEVPKIKELAARRGK